MAGRGWRGNRPDRPRGGDDQKEPGLAAADRVRMESGRGRQNGAAALSLAVIALCREMPALVPALSALLRHGPRRAVEHRLVLAAVAQGLTRHGAAPRRPRAD